MPFVAQCCLLAWSLTVPGVVGYAATAPAAETTFERTSAKLLDPAPPASGRGALVLEGGGAPATGVTDRVIAAAGPAPMLCVIRTAMHGLDDERDRFANRPGLRIESFDLGPDAPPDAPTLDRLRTCTGYYFNGGDPQHLSETFVPDGQAAPALDVIRERYLHHDAVVSGTSAGAMIVGRITLCECGPGSSESALLRGHLFEAPGFALIDPSVLVDAHFFARGLLGRHVWQMARRGFRTGVGIDEQTAVVVPGNGGLWQVIGQRAVALIRAPVGASVDDLHGFTLSLLAPGDRFDPVAGTVEVAASRRPFAAAARSRPPAPPLRDGAIFAPNRLRRLALRLAGGPADRAVGSDAQGRIVVALRRTPATRAFRDAAGTTVLDLALDIMVTR